MVYNLSLESVKITLVISECFKLNISVPYGSVLGPLFFFLYIYPFSQVITKYMDLKYHFYAYHIQRFIHLTPGNCTN